MRIQFQPAFSDYLALTWFGLRKIRWLILIAMAIPLVMFALAPMGLQFRGKNMSAWEYYRASLEILVSPGLFLLLIAFTYWSLRRQWRTVPALSAQREYEFGDQGVRMVTPQGENFTKWEGVSGAFCTKDAVYLAVGKRQFHFLPLSAIPSLDAFLDLLRQKVAVKDLRRKR